MYGNSTLCEVGTLELIIIILVAYFFQKDYNGLTFVILLATLTISSNRVITYYIFS